jgi:hypothetical protein
LDFGLAWLGGFIRGTTLPSVGLIPLHQEDFRLQFSFFAFVVFESFVVPLFFNARGNAMNTTKDATEICLVLAEGGAAMITAKKRSLTVAARFSPVCGASLLHHFPNGCTHSDLRVYCKQPIQ